MQCAQGTKFSPVKAPCNSVSAIRNALEFEHAVTIMIMTSSPEPAACIRVWHI